MRSIDRFASLVSAFQSSSQRQNYTKNRDRGTSAAPARKQPCELKSQMRYCNARWTHVASGVANTSFARLDFTGFSGEPGFRETVPGRKAVFGQSSAMRTQAPAFDLQLQVDTLPRGPCHGFAGTPAALRAQAVISPSRRSRGRTTRYQPRLRRNSSTALSAASFSSTSFLARAMTCSAMSGRSAGVRLTFSAGISARPSFRADATYSSP